jgi:hypothetical protein
MIATVMLSIDPTFLGHAPWLGTDAAGCAGFIAGTYLAIRWLARPTWKRSAAFGIALGLAIGAKYSCALLIPAVGLIALARVMLSRTPLRAVHRLPNIRRVLLAGAVAFVALWAVFCFDFAPMRYSALHFDPETSMFPNLPPALVQTPVPMPSLWLGYLFLSSRMNEGHPAYLNGRVLPDGSWMYFPEALVVKSSVGFLALLVATILLMALVQRGRRALRSAILLIPILGYLSLSIFTRYQLGIRHLLPIVPLMCVLIAMQMTRVRWRQAMLLGLMVLAAIETAVVHPDYLAFFNFASGGPSRGERYLVDSNLDWGQDFARLSKWLKGPEARGRPYSIRAFNATFDPSADSAYPMSFLAELGLDPQSVKVDPQALRDHPHGLLAISKNVRHRLEGAGRAGDGAPQLGPDYSWLDRYPIIKRIGYSIDVYDLDQPQRE